jgi:hypothetical protein
MRPRKAVRRIQKNLLRLDLTNLVLRFRRTLRAIRVLYNASRLDGVLGWKRFAIRDNCCSKLVDSGHSRLAAENELCLPKLARRETPSRKRGW